MITVERTQQWVVDIDGLLSGIVVSVSSLNNDTRFTGRSKESALSLIKILREAADKLEEIYAKKE